MRRKAVFAVLADEDTGPVVEGLLWELSHLIAAADPMPAKSEGEASAEPGMPGEATQWARSALAEVERELRSVTRRVQAALSVPPAERTLIDAEGACVTCGRRRRPSVRGSDGPSKIGRKVLGSQRERIDGLVLDLYASTADAETDLGVTFAELDRTEAQRLIRRLVRMHTTMLVER